MDCWTGYGGRLHAHPIQPDTSETPDQPIRVEFRGLPDADISRIRDVYCPEVHRSPFVEANNVNCLDVVSCWKGISFYQAAEIAMWKRLLGHALREQLEPVVKAIFLADDWLQTIESTVCAPSRRCMLPIDLRRLVHDMMTSAYSEPPMYPHTSPNSNPAMHPNASEFTTPSIYSYPSMQWFVSSRDLPGMVYNFVRTHGCFRDAQPHIQADLSFEIVDEGICIGAEIMVQSPQLQFPDLAATVQPGVEFLIAPAKPPVMTSGFPQFAEDTAYKLQSTSLLLAWDSVRGFRAVVPREGIRESTIEATLTATTILLFPGNVRHERTSRYHIKLEIDERDHSPQALDHSPQDLDQSPQDLDHLNASVANLLAKSDEINNLPFYARQDKPTPVRCRKPKTDPAVRNTKTDTCRTPKTFTGRIPKTDPDRKTHYPNMYVDKRLAFRAPRLALDLFEHMELESVADSQKPKCSIDTDNRVAMSATNNDQNAAESNWDAKHIPTMGISTTTYSGEALRDAPPTTSGTSWVERLRNGDDLDVPRKNTRAYAATVSGLTVMPALRKSGSVKRMVFQHRKESGLQQDYPSLGLSCSPSPTTSAHDPIQAEIQRNYKEFMSSKYANMSASSLNQGCTKDEDDDHEQRKAVEDAFLDGSQTEGWSTDTDASSVGR